MPKKAAAPPRTRPRRQTDMPPVRVEYFDGRSEVVTVTQRELAFVEREVGDLSAAFAATPHDTARRLAHAALSREGRTALDLDEWDETVRSVLDATV